METKYRFYVFPEKKDDLNKVETELNKIYPERFCIFNSYITTTKPFINMDEDSCEKIVSVAKENLSHSVMTWFSDDITMGGMVFNDHTTADKISVDDTLS